MTLEHRPRGAYPTVAPPDEQPYAAPGAAAPLVPRDDRGRVAGPDAARALARMPRRSAFVPRKLACDPGFEVHNRRRLEWTRKRRQELHGMTGCVSYAVGAMVVAAGWLYAAGEYAAERAAATGDVDLFKSAATLTATARTHDFGAYELAVREAAARPRAQGDPMAATLARIHAMAGRAPEPTTAPTPGAATPKGST